MEITGKIKFIDQIKEVGSSGFKKRDVVVTTDEQYPQHILIQFVQDKCDLLNGFAVGQHVIISINLRGREWVNPQGETVYFNTIQGWKIGKDMQHAANNMPQNQQPAPAAPEPKSAQPEEEHDDLPF